MRGLLINLKPEIKILKIPPYALLSLESMVRDKHDVKVLDCALQKISTKKLLKKINPTFDFVGFSCLFRSGAIRILNLVKKIKKMYPNIYVIVGGEYASVNYEFILKGGVDFIIMGEGEETFLKLLDSLEKCYDITKVDGLSFIKDGKVVKTRTRDLLNMDCLPLVKCDLIEKSNHKFRFIETSRGCNHTCKFCFVKKFWLYWRAKSVKRIVNEFIEAKKDLVDCLVILDNNFAGLKPERIRRLCIDIINQKINIDWICTIRADFVTTFPEIINLMKKAGCVFVFIGFESMNDNILKEYSKNTTANTNLSALKILRANKILIEGAFILGYANEKLMEMQKTIKFARKCDIWHLYVLGTYGTPLKRRKNLTIPRLLVGKEYIYLYIKNSLKLLFEKNYITHYLLSNQNGRMRTLISFWLKLRLKLLF